MHLKVLLSLAGRKRATKTASILFILVSTILFNHVSPSMQIGK